MDFIQRELDTHATVNYFSFPLHSQKRNSKIFRDIWSQTLTQSWRKSEIARWSYELEKLNMFPGNLTNLEGISNGKRAFFMGNALVIGVVEKIARSLINKIS